MRKLIFRAWMNNAMYYKHSVSLQIDGTIVYLDTDGNWKEDCEKEVILMQYTGLKDKHGVEMFEGDIVRTDVNRKLWIVTYENHQFNFDNRLISSQGRWESYSFKTYLDLLKKANANLEYMGNIHEDKHLLSN